MKNQYFGDINDYRKYGLLRVLQPVHDGTLLVAWMLTPDDGSRDGGFRSYLQERATWRNHDPELFDGLSRLLQSAGAPAVSLLEGAGLLPRTAYYSAVVPDARPGREVWRQGLLDAACNVDLVFVDPDNGIEVASKPIGRKGSSKYVTWEELRALWNAGRSLLSYQHFRREPRDAFAHRLVSKLRERTGASLVQAFRTPHVLFLLAAQDSHAPRFRQIAPLLSERWKGQIRAMELANKRLQPAVFGRG
jgi:hypothetical protein